MNMDKWDVIAHEILDEPWKYNSSNDIIIRVAQALRESVQSYKDRCERMEKALKPFAEWCNEFPSCSGEDLYIYHGRAGKSEFTKTMCINAKQALSDSKEV
jgi:hypothetical protein